MTDEELPAFEKGRDLAADSLEWAHGRRRPSGAARRLMLVSADVSQAMYRDVVKKSKFWAMINHPT